jgi:F-type H+-transporting ATPase subunit epsilon
MAMHVDIVSVEEAIYSGPAQGVLATGLEGELEILPGHTALLTTLVPGPVRVKQTDGQEEVIYVSGGVLEVQPTITTILADTVVRAKDINAAEAQKAIDQAQTALADHQSTIDYASARSELIRAVAMLRALKKNQGR